MTPDTPGSRALLLLAALFGASGVALGAFGAHGLKNLLEPRLLEVFNTAVQYQLLHALALLALALWTRPQTARALRLAGWAWVVGIVLFSGSLYAYVLSYSLWGVRLLAMITPLGGVFFILGWLALLWAAWKMPTQTP
ncbi:MAG: DUF423 domain-containing protein [Pseudomonadota bacterium]